MKNRNLYTSNIKIKCLHACSKQKMEQQNTVKQF